MVMIYLMNTCLSFDFVLMFATYIEKAFHFIKQKIQQRKNKEKFVIV